MSLLTVTETAKEALLQTLEGSDADVKGVRISIQSKGCSGLAWNLELVRTPSPQDDVQALEGSKYNIYIDKKATLYILGTQLDYKTTDLESGFTFINPREKGRCGCGQSFYV